jgi:hypothetical protein
VKTTVTIPEGFWLWAKAEAAKRKITLSKVVTCGLIELMVTWGKKKRRGK